MGGVFQKDFGFKEDLSWDYELSSEPKDIPNNNKKISWDSIKENWSNGTSKIDGLINKIDDVEMEHKLDSNQLMYLGGFAILLIFLAKRK
jgi:hypothetical protein